MNTIISLKEETAFLLKKKQMQNNLAGEIAAQHIGQNTGMSDRVSFLSTRKKEKFYKNDPRIQQTETEALHTIINILHT